MNHSSAQTELVIPDPRATKAVHYPQLDGLRALAVMQVLLMHFLAADRPTDATWFVAGVNMISVLGNGVHLFFVLSGFLITSILLRSRDSSNYFRAFYARRTLRIFPVYYLVLLLTLGTLSVLVLTGVAVSDEAREAFNNQWWLWLYVSNFSQGIAGIDHSFAGLQFGHFWTLAVEEQFYLVWPLIIFILPRRIVAFVCVLACIALPIARRIFSDGETIVPMYVLNLDGLFLGGLLAIAWERISSSIRLRRGLYVVACLAALCYATSFLTTGMARAGVLPSIVGPISRLPWPDPTTCLVLAYAGLVHFAITTKAQNPIRKILEIRPLTFIGKISYGLYVYHYLFIVYYFMFARELTSRLPFPVAIDWMIHLLIATTLSIATASISWFLFEQPILRLKSRFSYRAAKP